MIDIEAFADHFNFGTRMIASYLKKYKFEKRDNNIYALSGFDRQCDPSAFQRARPKKRNVQKKEGESSEDDF